MLRAATIQLVSTDNVDDNLNHAARLIESSANDGAEFILLPENFCFMGMQEHDKVAIAEPYGNGPIQAFLASCARQHRIWLQGGTIPLKANAANKVRAAALLFDPQGECVARYDKIHLFDVQVQSGGDDNYRESNSIEAGNQIIVARTPIANIGLSVCYDLRFPELYRNMLNQAVNIITVPSAFTATTGKAHWEHLLRSRAIENLCYVIASNQGGTHINGRITWGHSMIIDPWGDILACIDEGEGFVCADLDFEQQEAFRKRFPAIQHRELDYSKI